MDILITLVILLFSVIVHEIMHGIVAEKLGDDTAREAGRITLNPIPHIDPFGSILLPGIMILAQLPIILAGGHPIVLGAAKPVPVLFERLRPRKLGMFLVSLAGPVSNFVLAGLFALPLIFGIIPEVVERYWMTAVILNIILGTFNALPIPPLDGSKIIASMLPDNIMYKILEMERFGFLLVLALLFLGILGDILEPVIEFFLQIFQLN